MRFQLPRVPVGALGRGTLISTFGLVTRAVLQAGYLVLLSRWLGAEGYGLFAGSVAATVVFAPLATGGMGLVFTERLMKRSGGSKQLWTRVATQSALSGLVVALVVLALAALFLPVRLPMLDMALLAAAELLALPLVYTSTAALLAQGRVGLATISVIIVPLSRLLGAIGLLLASAGPSVPMLVVTHCLGTFVASTWVLAFTKTAAGAFDAGEPADGAPGRWMLAREGAPYALGAWAGTSYAEVDKVLILQLLGAGPAGIYTAAYRVVSVLVLPINALLSNALPRLFAARSSGDFVRVVRAVVFAAMGYSVLGALAAGVFATLMPVVFGADYAGSSRYVLLLSAWVPLAALHLTGANALLAAGGKFLRMAIEMGGLLVVVLVTVWLAPRIGGEGAVAGLLTAEALMAIGCWAFTLRRTARSRHG